jgi:hypothetical protein
MKKVFSNQTTENLQEKINSFISSLDEFSSKLNGDIYNFRFLIADCMQNVPEQLKQSLIQTRPLERKRNLAIAKESLEQCKQYLSMISRMRMISTGDLIAQVEKINELIEKQ